MQKDKVSFVELGDCSIGYLNHQNRSDIIPGSYEGGFQLWQCSVDLLKYMKNVDFNNKIVMDIGCGHGLLGIYALMKGAKFVYFQDFNKEVLEEVTKYNISINCSDYLVKCGFEDGDWSKLADTVVQYQQKLDIVLGSQLIYNEKDYGKLTKVFKNLLRQDGYALLANKLYYFGVGGNMASFKSHLESLNLSWNTLAKIVPPKGGNKRQIIEVKKPQVQF